MVFSSAEKNIYTAGITAVSSLQNNPRHSILFRPFLSWLIEIFFGLEILDISLPRYTFIQYEASRSQPPLRPASRPGWCYTSRTVGLRSIRCFSMRRYRGLRNVSLRFEQRVLRWNIPSWKGFCMYWNNRNPKTFIGECCSLYDDRKSSAQEMMTSSAASRTATTKTTR